MTETVAVSRDIAELLQALAIEIAYGPRNNEAYVLNSGDVGLVGSLARLSAESASRLTETGSSIAAHAEHVCYGLSLINKWAAGEDAWRNADWSTAWRRTRVTDDEWTKLIASLADESHRWIAVLSTPREAHPMALKAVIGSVVHIAYHLGAIRQINSASRGPREGEASA